MYKIRASNQQGYPYKQLSDPLQLCTYVSNHLETLRSRSFLCVRCKAISRSPFDSSALSVGTRKIVCYLNCWSNREWTLDRGNVAGRFFICISRYTVSRNHRHRSEEGRLSLAALSYLSITSYHLHHMCLSSKPCILPWHSSLFSLGCTPSPWNSTLNRLFSEFGLLPEASLSNRSAEQQHTGRAFFSL